jgi:uncharacterized protein YggE
MKPIVLSFLLIAMGTPAAWAQSAVPVSEPVLTVNGTAEVRVTPDVATVRLGVVGQADTAASAQDGVNAAAGRILEALGAAGVQARHIQTSRLTLTPMYSRQRPGEGNPRIVAYRADNTVTVRVEDLTLLGAVIDDGLRAGANQLQGVTFGLIDDLPAREIALAEAISEARRKAQAMAEALDVRLEAVILVNEGGLSIQRPMMEGRMMAMQEGAPTPVSAGEVTVSASVSIRYRIGPN